MTLNQEINRLVDRYDARWLSFYSDFIRGPQDYIRRDVYPVHVTASLFALSDDLAQTALIHHKATGKWFQPGGHVDAGETVRQAACRECAEETGLVAALPPEAAPVSIDLHRIPENPKKGEPEHYHLDIRFAARVSGTLSPDPDEVHDARWFPAEVLDTIDERVRPRLAAICI